MKYSQYNSLIPFKERFLLYNSLSQKLLVLDKNLKELIDDARKNISLLEYGNQKLYQTIMEKQFFVDDNLDEFDVVRGNIEKEIYNNQKYSLTINPTLDCNFRCWYCYEEHIKGSKISTNGIEKIENCIINIIDQNKDLKHFALTFFGGEPLLYFQKICLPLIHKWDKLTERNNIGKTLTFTTNGYLINEKKISELRDYAHYTHLQITLDGYKDFHDKIRYSNSKKGSYNKIIDNIKMLVDNDFNVRLRINYTPESLGNCSKIIDDLDDISIAKKNNLSISFHCVWQESSKMSNMQNELFEQMDYFIKSGFSVNSAFHLRTYEQICYADKKNSAVINFNGDVFKCTARDFEASKRDGILNDKGEIIWDDTKKKARMNSFINKPCRTCRILPHCFGSCSQVRMEAIEAKKEYCVYDFDQEMIDRVILNHILQLIQI